MGLQREDLRLQFFEIAGFDPERSYGSCIVLTRTSRNCTGRSRPACAPRTAGSW
ncbi:hypothetical protein [Catenuloplanes indicus]|uniref:Uncharacterized protein n=1 Tax=Catenuloplanes indicus TaxID=137267 RepID=A0AAE3VSK4_9ACTN|nr:hypothetical protein [Catenuloplanes indicus]MDQ0363493.1 hypothetical protein [Catenuloplanes indicus]